MNALNKSVHLNQTNNNYNDRFMEEFHFKFSWILYFVLILIMWLTAFGNMLVCLAVYKEKKLQTSTNLFLVSLAVADLMVAVFVMPTSFLVELLDYYPFESVWCIVWILLDILFCTSSIHHMSTMALDRYLTIKFPLKYGRNKSKRMAFIKICLIWLISICLCSPLLVISLLDQTNVYDSRAKQCVLVNKSFKLYGSLFAFYIPFLIMLVAYAKTIRILKLILDNKQRLDETMHQKSNSKYLLSEAVDHKLNDQSSTVFFFKSKSLNNVEKVRQVRNEEPKAAYNTRHSPASTMRNAGHEMSSKPRSSSLNMDTSSKIYTDLKKLQSVDGKNCANKRKSESTCRSISNNNNYQNMKKVANNERKALRVLIIMFSVFATLWSPFFILNTLSAIFEDRIKANLVLSKYESSIYSTLTWLGYLSSMTNPIVYTMFNKAFRKAFLDIFTCKLEERPRSSHPSLTKYDRFYFNHNLEMRRNLYKSNNHNHHKNSHDSLFITNFHI